MSIFHRHPSMLIPYSWQRAPLMPHAFIIRDRIYSLYLEPERNWNAYYSPAYERKKNIRAMSGRVVRHYEPRRLLPNAATVHYLSQLRMQRHLDNIRSMKNRL